MSHALQQLLSHLAEKPGMGLTHSATPAPPARTADTPTPLPALLPREIHEWFSLDDLQAPTGPARKHQWPVPLTLLTLLAGRAAGDGRRVVFIGRNCWPTFQILCAAIQGGSSDTTLQAGHRIPPPHHASHALHKTLN